MDLILETCFLLPQIFPPLGWPSSCRWSYSLGKNLDRKVELLVAVDDGNGLLRSGCDVAFIVAVEVDDGLLSDFFDF